MTDWKVGDLAVRINHSADPRNLSVKGEIYTVATVAIVGGHVALTFAEIGHPSARGYYARNFRKVQHDKPEACETAFTVLLSRNKRKVGA